MPSFRKKPVVIEAVQFVGVSDGGYPLPGSGSWPADWPVAAWKTLTVGPMHPHPEAFIPKLIIPTLEGDHYADLSDWIIRGVKGEFYPCKPDIFAATYDPASPGLAPETREGGDGSYEWAYTESLDILHAALDGLPEAEADLPMPRMARRAAAAILRLRPGSAPERGDGALRERVEALAKQYEEHAARISWGDKCDMLMTHAQDLRFALRASSSPSAPPSGDDARDAWYLADGSTVMLPAEEVTRRRKVAAVVLGMAKVVLDGIDRNGGLAVVGDANLMRGALAELGFDPAVSPSAGSKEDHRG